MLASASGVEVGRGLVGRGRVVEEGQTPAHMEPRA